MTTGPDTFFTRLRCTHITSVFVFDRPNRGFTRPSVSFAAFFFDPTHSNEGTGSQRRVHRVRVRVYVRFTCRRCGSFRSRCIVQRWNSVVVVHRQLRSFARGSCGRSSMFPPWLRPQSIDMGRIVRRLRARVSFGSICLRFHVVVLCCASPRRRHVHGLVGTSFVTFPPPSRVSRGPSLSHVSTSITHPCCPSPWLARVMLHTTDHDSW